MALVAETHGGHHSKNVHPVGGLGFDVSGSVASTKIFNNYKEGYIKDGKHSNRTVNIFLHLFNVFFLQIFKLGVFIQLT